IATPTTKGSSWLKASIAAPISFRKQRLILAASSDDNGGERRVFEKPFRGVFVITPIAHLCVIAGFRRAAVNISCFIVCVHGERISVCLQHLPGICLRAIVRIGYSRILIFEKKPRKTAILCRLRVNRRLARPRLRPARSRG